VSATDRKLLHVRVPRGIARGIARVRRLYDDVWPGVSSNDVIVALLKRGLATIDDERPLSDFGEQELPTKKNGRGSSSSSGARNGARPRRGAAA
jgi:hypothetical protein